MKPDTFVITPDSYTDALNVLGVQVTVLANKKATQSYEITLVEGNEDSGPPPHHHGWDESFFILEGSVRFTQAGKTETCPSGSLVHIPADTTHAFQFGTGGGKMLEFTGKGGNATTMFASVDKQVPPGPPDLPFVTRVLRENGVTLDI